MQATKISLENAKQNKLFYFVANVVIYRESDGRCLIMKRDEREVAHPGKYAVAGGKLEWSDLPLDNPTRVHDEVMDYENKVEDLLMREAREESGLEIEPKLKYINSVAYIRPDETPTVMVKFAAKYKSGEVKLEEGGFVDYAWVNAEEVKNYPCILGVPEEVAETIRLFAEEAKIGV